MISIILYGRNDSYGYNLHKRAALGINCMAEVLSDPADEILFVDYNTPDDYPTFPEAIADTLTDKAAARLRILRVRSAIHDRLKGRTHLKALEPIARNVAIRRSNPANRWILSTNTDMIFVPRGRATISEIAADLAPGFYHLPRFEIPESLWEGFDRKNPAAVIDQVRTFGRSMFLNEIVYGAECIKYDGPGDFQLIQREDLFRIHGFHEEMILGWHVDSNIAKRLFLMYGVVGDVVDRLFGYHCDHTRQVTPSHQHRAVANDSAVFIDSVSFPEIPEQSETWGCASDTIEEIRLARSAHHVYLDGLSSVVQGEWAEPVYARYTYDSYDQCTYDPRHVLPFLADLFVSAPREWTLGWVGGRADSFAMFRQMWMVLGFQGGIVIDDWTAPLLATAPLPEVRLSDSVGIDAAADVIVIDFGAPSESPHPLEAQGVSAARLDEVVDQLARKSFFELIELERSRLRQGLAPRRFICINAVHNRYESLVRDEIGVASTPFATRLRHGFVTPERSGVSMPPDAASLEAPPAGRREAEYADVLTRLTVSDGGHRVGARVNAPFGRRGYVVRGFPYERLLPGTYQAEFVFTSRGPFTLSAYLKPVIIEVVHREGYLAREECTFLMNTTRTVTFTVPADHPEGLSGVEVRVFRGRWVNFAVSGLRIWRLPPKEQPALLLPVEPDVPVHPLLHALGLPSTTSSVASR